MMKRKNFTLIEILGVCALIAILGIIGFGSYTFAMNKSKDSATQALLKQIEAGLANVKQECGYYPSTNKKYVKLEFYGDGEEGSDVTNTLAGKLKKINTTEDKSVRKAFNKATDAETIAKYVESNVLKDAFGNSIYYCFPGHINKTSYDLVSAGPDGVISKENKDLEKIESEVTKEDSKFMKLENFKDADGEAVCDDITNF